MRHHALVRIDTLQPVPGARLESSSWPLADAAAAMLMAGTRAAATRVRQHGRTRALVLAALVVAGCEAPVPEYFPLAAGREWHYRVVRTTMDGETRQVHVVRNLPVADRNAGATAVRVAADGSRHYYAHQDAGVFWLGSRRRGEAQVRLLEPAPLALPAAPVPGLQWRAAGRTLVLEKTGPPQETLYRLEIEVAMHYTIATVVETVTVPAGRYTDCLRIEGRGTGNANVRNYLGNTRVEIETTDWYAPGVGLVRAERRERTDKAALDHGALVLELQETALH